jgi:hypothetical protein
MPLRPSLAAAHTAAFRLMPSHLEGRTCVGVLICIALASCATSFPATIIMQDRKNYSAKILRGSTHGHAGQEVVFTASHVDGLSCEGKMSAPGSDTHTEGTLDCNNDRTGRFLAKSKEASWVGEGTLDDGSKFVISIGRDADER